MISLPTPNQPTNMSDADADVDAAISNYISWCRNEDDEDTIRRKCFHLMDLVIEAEGVLRKLRSVHTYNGRIAGSIIRDVQILHDNLMKVLYRSSFITFVDRVLTFTMGSLKENNKGLAMCLKEYKALPKREREVWIMTESKEHVDFVLWWESERQSREKLLEIFETIE